MILLDSDVAIDFLRNHPNAVAWTAALPSGGPLALPGYVVLELLNGCRDATDRVGVEQLVVRSLIVWLEPGQSRQALDTYRQIRPANAIGVLDMLIAQTALALGEPLHTFNQKHYNAVPGLRTVQPYVR
jgi:predicted nucleic acid-binding protein